MTLTKSLFCASAVLLLAACSSTTTQNGDVNASSAGMEKVGGVSAVASTDSDDVGLRCKRVQVTGTRMTEKYCTTKEQRDRAARNARDAQNQVGIKAQQIGGPASG